MKLIVFDLESTITEDEFWDTFPETGALMAKAMAGNMDFCESLKARFRLVKGMSKREFESHASELTLREGADDFFSWAHARKMEVGVVSGGFDFFTKLVAEELGVEHWAANYVNYSEGKVVGVKEPILDSWGKRRFVNKLQEKLRIPVSKTIVVGDGANDLKMMELAGVKVGMCAKSIVASQVDYNVKSFDELKALLEKMK